MRPLTKSEIALLIFCLAAVFLVGNAIAYQKYSKKVSDVEQELADLGLRRESASLDSGKAAVKETRPEGWEARMDWLDRALPEMGSRDQAQAALLEYLQEGAKKYDLQIEQQRFMKPAGTSYYQEVSVNMQVDGSERKVYQWLAEMQAPDLFQVMKFMSIEPEGNAQRPELECNVILARWFKP